MRPSGHAEDKLLSKLKCDYDKITTFKARLAIGIDHICKDLKSTFLYQELFKKTELLTN